LHHVFCNLGNFGDLQNFLKPTDLFLSYAGVLSTDGETPSA